MNGIKTNLLFGIPLLILVVAGCSLGIDEKQSSITRQDIQIATQVIGESLSDENSGIIGSINDAITSVSANGFVRTSQSKSKTAGHDDKAGRGEEVNVSYSYNAGTGIHLFSFERRVNLIEYHKEVIDTTRYIYRDPSGIFIQFPDQSTDLIESIRYTDKRTGTIETPDRNSFFNRRDTFSIAGLSGTASPASIEGKHQSEGTFRQLSGNGNFIERSYSLEVNFLDIQFPGISLTEKKSLEQGVKGALTYKLNIRDSEDTSDSRTLRGSIDLIGDGTALLRLDQRQNKFQVNLDNGSVRDISSKFEGQIVSVNLQDRVIKLANGIRAIISDDARIEVGGDLFSLEAVADAIQKARLVRAEGEGFIEGGFFHTVNVEFEIDDDVDDENDDIDFRVAVQSIDLATQSFELSDGRAIRLDENSVIDGDGGDYATLEEVNDVLQQGITVIVDGNARYVEDGDFHFILIEAEFEMDDGSSGSGSGEETYNFEANVLRVDVSAQTFTLDNGAVIEITADTEIKGDLLNLQSVEEALGRGEKVEADGTGVEEFEPNDIDLTATRVDFEIIDS